MASRTDDRYQVVVHVDSDVLSQKVFEKQTGEPDCYIEKQVGLKDVWSGCGDSMDYGMAIWNLECLKSQRVQYRSL